MARQFVVAAGTDTDFLSRTSTPVSAAPMTLSAWGYSTGNSSNWRLFHVIDSTGGNPQEYFGIGISEGISCSADCRTSSFGNQNATGGAPAINTWNHYAAVYSSTTNRNIYLNGTAGTPNTNSSVPSGTTNIICGRHPNGGSDSGTYGAEFAIWDVALTQDEITALSKGCSPLLIRPDHLLMYVPCVGRASPEFSIKGDYPLTVNGTCAQFDHPRIFNPVGAQVEAIGGAAPPTSEVCHLVTAGGSLVW